jgi:hypothetical protein
VVTAFGVTVVTAGSQRGTVVICWPSERVECFNYDGFQHFGRQPYLWPAHTYLVYMRGAEPMARVPKMVLYMDIRISLARGIQYSPFFLNFFCPLSISIL